MCASGPVQPIEHLRPSVWRPARAQRRLFRYPRANERLADSLPPPLGGDHAVSLAPRPPRPRCHLIETRTGIVV